MDSRWCIFLSNNGGLLFARLQAAASPPLPPNLRKRPAASESTAFCTTAHRIVDLNFRRSSATPRQRSSRDRNIQAVRSGRIKDGPWAVLMRELSLLMPSQPLVHLDTATHPLHYRAAHFATPHPINHHYHRGGGDINNIFIAAATIRGEPRPALPPLPHFSPPPCTPAALWHRTRCLMSRW